MNHHKSLKESRLARLGLLLTVWLAVTLAVAGAVQADPNLPMSYQPLGNALLNLPGSDWAAVQEAAKAQTTSQPAYKSNAVENVTFSGYFQATDNTTQLAILSDDGVDVYIDGQKVVSGYQSKQALPNLANSLTPISQTFDPAHIYFIKIVYSNVILTGPDDIDGVTLFCYGGGGSLVNLNANVQVRRTGSGNSFGSSATIAAGSGGANQADILITLTDQNNSPASGVYIDTPQVVGGQGVSINASLNCSNTTDANGQVSGSYTSSDLIQPVTIQCLNSSGTINQHWDDLQAGDWSYGDYFSFDTNNSVTFTPAFVDGPNNIPIKNHSINLIVKSLDVWEWDDNLQQYTLVSGVDPSQLPGIATFTPATSNDTGNGTSCAYTSSLVVHYDENNVVDTVHFDALDNKPLA